MGNSSYIKLSLRSSFSHIHWFSLLCDVSWCIASIRFGATQSGFSALAAIGFVHLLHKQCIKPKQAVGIDSSDMNVGINRLCLVAIPGQQVNGDETFLHVMTMHHLWVANFLAFLSWKESICLAASTDGVRVTPYSLQMNSSTEERMFSVIIPKPTSASKPRFSKNTFLAVSWCVPI